MCTTKEASARSGNSEALKAQNPRQGTSDTANDITQIPVYKIIDEPFFHLFPVKPGANSRRIIKEAIRVLKTVQKSSFPTPMSVDFKTNETTVLCGKQFSIEKALDLRFGGDMRDAMYDTGVNYVSVMSVGEHHLPTITFGRYGEPEFIAYVVNEGR